MRRADVVAVLVSLALCAWCFAAYWKLAGGPAPHLERFFP